MRSWWWCSSCGHWSELGTALSDRELAERAARAAGELLMARFGGPARAVETKSSGTDMVSEADREAERAIVELLESERPDDGLLGEEGAAREGRSGRRWVVDPLDGTTNYLYGIPAWSVSIALEDAEGPLVGVVHQPAGGETFVAERGRGGTLGGLPLAVRDGARTDAALLATGFGYESGVREAQGEALRHILPRVRDVRRAGSAALDLAWVAAGRLDGYFERGGHAWDWAAGRLLVTEAGGALADLPGSPAGLVAAHADLLPDIVALIGEAERDSPLRL